jgi:phage baseplate assembly protein W
MPLPQTIRVNPLDLRRNIAIGVSLPFKGPFISTFTTRDQIKSNLINLLLTNKGERIMNPTFGCDIKKQLFQNITTDLQQNIINIIVDAVSIFIPEIQIGLIEVIPNIDYNQISITVYYKIRISNTPGQVTIQFETIQ